MLNKYFGSILLGLIIFCQCNGRQENDNKVNSIYVEKYAKLIESYEEESFNDSESAKSTFMRIVHIPEFNFVIRNEQTLIKRFEYNKSDALPKYIVMDSPPILDFASLSYVSEVGDMWFSGVSGSLNSIYRIKSNEIEQNQNISLEYYKEDNRELLLDNKIFHINFDKKKDAYYIKNLLEINIKNFPSYYYFGRIIYPVKNYHLIRSSGFSLMLQNHIFTNELIILLYDWKNNVIVKNFLLPGLGKYRFFNFGIGKKDSKERLYFYIPIDFHNHTSALTKGYILIYDIFKDIIYYISHPLLDSTCQEIIFEINYILGENENIYYQLVTDKAYYIYKIEPFWDKSMEETDYNPVFFDFYPELKAEWDKLQEQTE